MQAAPRPWSGHVSLSHLTSMFLSLCLSPSLHLSLKISGKYPQVRINQHETKHNKSLRCLTRQPLTALSGARGLLSVCAVTGPPGSPPGFAPVLCRGPSGDGGRLSRGLQADGLDGSPGGAGSRRKAKPEAPCG
uniref:Uncharacterized protein n=1 Tax=Pipistrellus kuhlii TaxID=59472 RepID=A0A7J7XAM6_PIPKU|nr:hypothetical protein mPipKuh1_010571 [Pipistrellus kuhlii]